MLEETPIGRIRAGVRRAHRERSGFAEASGGGLFAVNRDLARAEADEANAWANLRRAAFGDGWLDASLSYFARDEISASPAIPAGVFDASPATESDTQFRRVQANASASFDVTDKIGVSSGVDVQVEEGERTGAVDLGFAVLPSAYELDRVVGAVFAEGRYRVGDGLDLSAAARVDDPDDGEARASGRVSLAYEAPGGVLLRASWANGHKLPSFYALGDTLVGNPTLKVELSETTELSAQKAFGALSLHATAFSSRYRDLIDFDFTTFKLVNRARARVDGVELSARFQPSDALLLNVHATFTDIDVGGSEAGLLNRPEAYGGALVEWRPNADWTLQANLQVVGARGGSSIPPAFAL
ncbi:MAG: TonB-dependent receptor [Terricaulis sp.]